MIPTALVIEMEETKLTAKFIDQAMLVDLKKIIIVVSQMPPSPKVLAAVRRKSVDRMLFVLEAKEVI